MVMLTPGLEARVTMEPRLTARIRLALKILQVPRAELDGLIEEAMADNPFIEELPWDAPPSRASRRDDDDSRAALENIPDEPSSLMEELLAQLRCSHLSSVERRIAESIVGNLDEDGFLEVTCAEIALQSDVWPAIDRVERVLANVQQFDPPGIAARNRAESFVLQLRRKGFDDASLPVRLVRDYLSSLVRKPVDAIARTLDVSTEDLRAAARIVARLDPSPGRREEGRSAWIVPDVTVRQDGGEFVVVVNDENVPKLRLREIPDRSFSMRTWRRSAQWLLDALKQRRETLLAVTSSIVRAQHEFLEGSGPLRPLSLREVAREVGRHQSTVCRAVADKYIATPSATLALKSFFARRTDSRGDVSADQVKGRIADLLLREDKARPLTDEQIATALSKTSLQVSRRTVGKYREELGVPSGAARRCRSDR